MHLGIKGKKKLIVSALLMTITSISYAEVETVCKSYPQNHKDRGNYETFTDHEVYITNGSNGSRTFTVIYELIAYDNVIDSKRIEIKLEKNKKYSNQTRLIKKVTYIKGDTSIVARTIVNNTVKNFNCEHRGTVHIG